MGPKGLRRRKAGASVLAECWCEQKILQIFGLGVGAIQDSDGSVICWLTSKVIDWGGLMR